MTISRLWNPIRRPRLRLRLTFGRIPAPKRSRRSTTRRPARARSTRPVVAQTETMAEMDARHARELANTPAYTPGPIAGWL